MPKYWLDEDGRPLCCPPHDYDVVWLGPDDGGKPALYCRLCGEGREIVMRTVEAPVVEQYPKETRDYGELT